MRDKDTQQYTGFVEVKVLVSVPIVARDKYEAQAILDEKVEQRDYDLRDSDLLDTGETWVDPRNNHLVWQLI